MAGSRENQTGIGALRDARHICALFSDKNEEFSLLLPFIKEGLDWGERAVHLIETGRRDDHLARLKDIGIDVETTQRSGQLEVKASEETYLRGGSFDQEAMLTLIQEILEDGRAAGYPRTRLVADMEWALTGLPRMHDIVEYEARLNLLLPRYSDPVVCTYDARRFGGHVVMDILRTHPVVLVGGIFHENPFYLPPEAFLRELSARTR